MRVFFFFSSRRRHTRLQGDWSSDVCSSDLYTAGEGRHAGFHRDRRGIGGLGAGRAAQRGGRDAGDRESGVEGKRVDLGGRRIIKKKKKEEVWRRKKVKKQGRDDEVPQYVQY